MNIVVSNTSGVPIYEQIAKAIKNEILSGDLKGNSALPSIRSLASELRVSVITTKRAYEEKLREIEEKLGEAIDIANSIGLNFNDLVGMLKTLKEL